MAHPGTPEVLEPKIITDLKGNPEVITDHLATRMSRSISHDMREERDDLRAVAEQSLNAIMDLGLDGNVRWISQSWFQLTGVKPEDLYGKAICDVVYDNKTIFADAVTSMRKDDAKSRIIRFGVLGAPIPIASDEAIEEGTSDMNSKKGHICLEAQGIMVYDRSTSHESHTMWMIKPAVDRAVTIDLPAVLVESLGIGAHVLAQYLTELAEAGTTDAAQYPPPAQVLCRICERTITPWWFEKHTELCLQEHKSEMDIQVAHEALTEHRASIVKVLDALEAQSLSSRSGPGETSPASPKPQAEYKGLPIGPSSQTPTTTTSANASGRASPTQAQSSQRDRSASGSTTVRARSFAVRRPLARIVELVLDLCDTALEINVPTIKDNPVDPDEEIRTQSPQSENRIAQVMHWQSPSASTLESEQGLAMLCDDTADLSRLKVEAGTRHARVLEYSERIRTEFNILVHECIEAALGKAARIAKGELSDASDSEGSGSETEPMSSPGHVGEELHRIPSSGESAAKPTINTSTAPVPISLRNTSDPIFAAQRRASSTATSTRSNSPGTTRTPRNLLGGFVPGQKSSPMAVETDFDAESDTSMHSSAPTPQVRAQSPTAESGLVRVASTRGRKRTSLALPSLQGALRQESPGRGGPLSPLRGVKSRFNSIEDSHQSPLLSPIAGPNNITSPIIKAQSHLHHHRRQSSVTMGEPMRCPSSPRPSAISSNPQPKAPQTSIKDFEIIKPISKGAFGSVYLAKKKVTGDYYALKVLKKDDMVAKNQITNVKAERAIMMWQGESDFVAKLYWTFASKDYLYLVMEYLNGGDCASLIKNLGGLPEDWAKKYIAEVVLGVQHLHSRQIIHRDLKPDNLLIDQHGHLKLTDFGLSRMGLVGRQQQMQDGDPKEGPDLFKHGPFRNPLSLTSSRSTSFDFAGTQQSPGATPSLMPCIPNEVVQPSYFSLNRSRSRDSSIRQPSGTRSDSGSDGDALQAIFRRFTLGDDTHRGRTPIEEEAASEEGESPDHYMLQHFNSHANQYAAISPPPSVSMLPPPMALFDPEDKTRRFVGTPDYLAPETINGSSQDAMSDWWSVGCILFEFLYGIPPFHAETPELVFENILARNVHWPAPEDDDTSAEARDLINKLITLDPRQRLGANALETFPSGGDEVRAHPWFKDIDWVTLREDEASFIPNPAGAEDTEYFDARGATTQNFSTQFDDQIPSPGLTPGGTEYVERPHDALSRVRVKVNSIKRNLMPLHIPAHVRDGRNRRLSEPLAADDFGSFQFKNLPVLEKANKDVLSKLRAEAMQAQGRSSQGISSPVLASPSPLHEASPVLSGLSGSGKRALSMSKGPLSRPKSPSLLSQTNSSPSRTSQPSSPLLVSFSAGQHHERRKTSSGSSSFSHSAASSLQPGSFFDAPKLSTSLGKTSNAASPIKLAKAVSSPVPMPSSADTGPPSRKPSVTSPRQRSLTISSQEGDAAADVPLVFAKRRSQIADVSPSSSDTEEQRQRVLMRVHRRRQGSRRLSSITIAEGPAFRPLDVLICEDHPVSRLVMERLLEKLRCRTISVQNGSEAVRYALSKVKFDIIMMEFKLPQINGADIARMIRETRNANSHTPIVAVTGYLKELQAPHDFDALVEKPATNAKLSEVLGRLCQWKSPPLGWTPAQMQSQYCPPSNLRKESLAMSESAPSTTASSGTGVFSAGPRYSSREDSITSGSAGDSESRFDSMSAVVNSKNTDRQDAELERKFGGLGISRESPGSQSSSDKQLTPRPAYARDCLDGPWASDKVSASFTPSKKSSLETLAEERKSQEVKNNESADAGDDEDDELGGTPQTRTRSSSKSKTEQQQQRPSKLATEMLRTNSEGSVISAEPQDSASAIPSKVMASPRIAIVAAPAAEVEAVAGNLLDPPEIFPMEPATETREVVDMNATPRVPQDGFEAVDGQGQEQGLIPGDGISPRS